MLQARSKAVKIALVQLCADKWEAYCLDRPDIRVTSSTADAAVELCVENLKTWIETFTKAGKRPPWYTVSEIRNYAITYTEEVFDPRFDKEKKDVS